MTLKQELDRVTLADIIAAKCIAINGLLKKGLLTPENHKFLDLHKGLIKHIEEKILGVSNNCIKRAFVSIEDTNCKQIILNITAQGFRHDSQQFEMHFSVCVLPTFALGVDIELADNKLKPKKVDDETSEFFDEIFESLSRELSSLYSERHLEVLCGYHPGHIQARGVNKDERSQ